MKFYGEHIDIWLVTKDSGGLHKASLGSIVSLVGAAMWKAFLIQQADLIL